MSVIGEVRSMRWLDHRTRLDGAANRVLAAEPEPERVSR
jgi:hypothetical protein